MIDDEPAGRAQRARPEAAAVAVAAQDQQIGVLAAATTSRSTLPCRITRPTCGCDRLDPASRVAAASSRSWAVVLAASSTVAGTC